jgi:mono/diheme cytochrome c family protein
VLGLTVACSSGPHAATGFRLPADGNEERGKAAFVEFQCNTCHEVSGVELSRPTVQPKVPVVLGGDINRPMSDGYLVTSIINPSYRLARYHPTDQLASEGKSRMPWKEEMTVRQLTDIVAFLQAQYRVRPPQPMYSYY